MEKRFVYTKIWIDEWFSGLSRAGKLLFIYCLTNSRIGFSGMYELPDRNMCFDTGLTPAELDAAKLELSPKVLFNRSWVCVINAQRLDPIRGDKNPLLKAFNKEIDSVPQEVMDYFNAPTETLTRGYEAPQGRGMVKEEEEVKVLSNKKRGVGENKPTEEEMLRVAELYQVPLAFVESKWDDVVNHCLSKGVTYSNYVAALRSFVKRDAIGIRKEQRDKSKITVVA